MHHFQPFPREPEQVTSQPQLDSLQVPNGIGGFNSIPFYRLHTVLARVQASRDMDSENMDRLQWSAENNEQKPEGPLVGDMESTELIRKQFAEADNVVYRVKSEALAKVFSYMRQMRPDGNCGWTALIFSYFEILLRMRNSTKFKDEIDKLKHINTILSQWYSEDTYIDWWEDTMNLLQATADSLSTSGDALAALVTTFNDGYTASALIQYFRMIVAAWIQDKASIYEPFILGETTAKSVADYCRDYLEMHTVEIDGIGISALCEAVLNPAGLGVKIKYLDTSPGAEANTHSLGPLDLHGLPVENLPTIWLLYTIRGPGHYDIIYKPEDLEVTEPVIMRASGSSHNTEYHWSKLDQIQPKLQSTTFQDDGQSHGGNELKDSCWNVPGSTVLEDPVTGASGYAYLPHGFRAYYEPFQEEAEDTIFADPSELNILPCNSQIESRTQDAGQSQLLCQESQEARHSFGLNTLPMADLQNGGNRPSELTLWPQANVQIEGTLHDRNLLQSNEYEIPTTPSPAYASMPFQSSADEPRGVSVWNASGPNLTSEQSMARHMPTSETRFIFRISNQETEHQDQLLLNPLASPNTLKKMINLRSPANFMREDWEPIQENLEPNGKAKAGHKQKHNTKS